MRSTYGQETLLSRWAISQEDTFVFDFFAWMPIWFRQRISDGLLAPSWKVSSQSWDLGIATHSLWKYPFTLSNSCTRIKRHCNLVAWASTGPFVRNISWVHTQEALTHEPHLWNSRLSTGSMKFLISGDVSCDAGQASLFALSSNNAMLQLMSRGGPRILENQASSSFDKCEELHTAAIDLPQSLKDVANVMGQKNDLASAQVCIEVQLS